MSEEEDIPQLSAETFAALSQFYKDQEDREKHLESIQIMAAEGTGVAQVETSSPQTLFIST